MKRKNRYNKSKVKFVKLRVHTFHLGWGANNFYSYNYLERVELSNAVSEEDVQIVNQISKIRPHKRFWKARKLAYKNGWSFRYVYTGKKISTETPK